MQRRQLVAVLKALRDRTAALQARMLHPTLLHALPLRLDLDAIHVKKEHHTGHSTAKKKQPTKI